ncbi:hypothetical protein BHE74_00034393, partial [Ensete ventricosum]
AKVQERKWTVHGEPYTSKLTVQSPPVSISGKRKQKLFSKWSRGQKEVPEKGLVTMQDVEMAVAEGEQFACHTYFCIHGLVCLYFVVKRKKPITNVTPNLSYFKLSYSLSN